MTVKQVEGKAILICFFDLNQRPSRYCLLQLSKQAEELRDKDIDVIGIQASVIEGKTISEWANKNAVSFPVGMIQDGEEETRFKWNVKSLPWLILTDREHIIRVEGFGLDELDGKIKH